MSTDDKLGADDALYLSPDMDPWDGEITHGELFAAKRGADVALAAERIRVRDDARSLVNAERAGGVGGLPEPLTLAHSLTLPNEHPQRWRIDGMMPMGGNVSLTAVRKIGKTVTSTNLLRSLVDGDLFLGRFDVMPVTGTVAFSNYEVSREQLDRWISDQGIRHPDRVVQFPFRGHRVPLNTDDGMEWMVKRLKRYECEVWFVDPFSAAYIAAGGVQENDNSEVRRFLERLNEIKTAAGVSDIVLTVHGSRGSQEGSERSRAASSLEDWPDALWQLNKGENGDRYFKVAAGRDVTEGEYGLALDLLTNRLTVAGGTRREARLAPIADAIVEYVDVNPGASANVIEEAMVAKEHKRNDTRRALASLISKGTLAVHKGPRNANMHHIATPHLASSPHFAGTSPERSATALASSPASRVNGAARCEVDSGELEVKNCPQEPQTDEMEEVSSPIDPPLSTDVPTCQLARCSDPRSPFEMFCPTHMAS